MPPFYPDHIIFIYFSLNRAVNLLFLVTFRINRSSVLRQPDCNDCGHFTGYSGCRIKGAVISAHIAQL